MDPTLLERFDKVIIMPSKQSPGKNMPTATEIDRLKMLSLCSFVKNSNLIIDDYELQSNDYPSFTIDSIKYVKNKFKREDIYLALGLDKLKNLDECHNKKILLNMVKIICFNRNGLIDKTALIRHEFIENFNYNMSSSDISTFIQNNDNRVKSMINKNIFNYIIKEKLYQ